MPLSPAPQATPPGGAMVTSAQECPVSDTTVRNRTSDSRLREACRPEGLYPNMTRYAPPTPIRMPNTRSRVSGSLRKRTPNANTKMLLV